MGLFDFIGYKDDEDYDPESNTYVKKDKKKTTLRTAKGIIKNIQTRRDIMEELGKQQ